jgi:hypothetical protein
MRRREFIALVGTTAAAWPFSAAAQQPATEYRWAEGQYDRLPADGDVLSLDIAARGLEALAESSDQML